MTQKFFSNELMRIADGYVPFRQGALKNSATIETDGTAINYNVPYARVHWYGKIMAGSLPKQPTEKDMNYQGAPIRGHRWVERAYADNKDAIIKAVESYMRNK
ncbi:minor capsid protein [Erysipelothrix sp. HDW6A]|uniref:minor capsid protein n=1 Tax=Erysipelothrix sp. HDW6A TaxID=2714928 RepID=UPI00196B1CE4|nr:minor capsid protein [Erysipelothrix sp. HDW6A]